MNLNPRQELELIEIFESSQGWKHFQGKYEGLIRFYESEKDKAITESRLQDAARYLGVAQGLRLASNLPLSILEKSKKQSLMRRAMTTMTEAREGLQSMMVDAFKNFSPEGEKQRHANNGG